MTTLGWIIMGVLAFIILTLIALYRRGVAERNQMTYYIGMLLLDDALRAAHKDRLDRFLLESKMSERALTTRVLLAIQSAANIPGRSAIVFHLNMLSRKQTLEKASATSGGKTN